MEGLSAAEGGSTTASSRASRALQESEVNGLWAEMMSPRQEVLNLSKEGLGRAGRAARTTIVCLGKDDL